MFMVNLSVHLGLQLSVVRLTFIAEGLNAVGHSLLIIFRLDALALSVIATATWLAGWLAGCPSQPVLYQND